VAGIKATHAAQSLRIGVSARRQWRRWGSLSASHYARLVDELIKATDRAT